MFRVFGSPFTLVLHQHVTYLRLKQLPFKVYCTSLTTTLFYGLVYRARNAFCCLTPSGSSRLQVWQLAESAELDEDLLTASARHGRKGEVKYVAVDGKPLAAPQRMLVSKRTHPQLHLAVWATVLYASWWLAKTGAMYRWVLGEDLDVVEGYMRYFMFASIPGLSFTRTLAPKFRQVMSRLTMVTGVSRETAPFMDEHFHRMCAALEEHFSQPRAPVFLLGTPHPTLADVTLGAAFSSSFLTDDPPAKLLAERYPQLVEYAERVTGWRGGVFVGDAALAKTVEGEHGEGTRGEGEAVGEEVATEGAVDEGDYPDVVPESLASFFAVMTEVYPFMMSQCASFNAYMSSDAVRTLKREPLEEPWEGCSGYLFPQMTNIRSLMIVDNTVCSVQARAQDLEIAFLASQEVMDEELTEFGRAPAGVRVAEAASRPSAQLNSPSEPSPNREVLAKSWVSQEAGDEAAGSSTSHVPDTSAAVAVAPPAPAQESSPARNEVGGVPLVEEEDGVLLGSTGRPRGSMIVTRPMDITDAGEADFYRVFTRRGIRQFAPVTLDRSLSVHQRSRAVGAGTAASAREAPPSVHDHLSVLRGMLAKMRSPQYTLTSVFHGRRMYVAVIPEYEVAKLREKRAAAKAAATAADPVLGA